jgi:hypothetical protein
MKLSSFKPLDVTNFGVNTTKARLGHGFPQRAKSGAHYQRAKQQPLKITEINTELNAPSVF